jgi:hypothetical protein
LSLYKTKAQAHRELWIYKFKMARLAAKKKSTGQWKRMKCGWHAKLLKRQQQLLQQDSARAGRGVLLWLILSGHSNSDPFPNSPLFPRDLSRDRGASPQAEHRAQGEVGVVQEVGASSSTAQAEGAHAEGAASSSAQEDNSPQGAQASSASSSAPADNTLLGGQAGATSSVQGGDKQGDSSALGGHIGLPSYIKVKRGQALRAGLRGGIRVREEGTLHPPLRD